MAHLSDSLEEMACTIFPGVVQREVTGFRSAGDDSRKDSHASPLVRERTVGAGMIVDPDGYIMTTEQPVRNIASTIDGDRRVQVVGKYEIRIQSERALKSALRGAIVAKLCGAELSKESTKAASVVSRSPHCATIAASAAIAATSRLGTY